MISYLFYSVESIQLKINIELKIIEIFKKNIGKCYFLREIIEEYLLKSDVVLQKCM